MAVAMKKAFLKIINREVSAEEGDKDLKLKNGLKCNYCGIPVYHRTTHQRNEVSISAHFYRKGEYEIPVSIIQLVKFL